MINQWAWWAAYRLTKFHLHSWALKTDEYKDCPRCQELTTERFLERALLK